MVIPDDESGSKTYYLSKKLLYVGLYSVFTIIITAGLFFYYFIPKVNDYVDIKRQFDQFASERIRVLELTRDLERLKQMDQLVRSSLGNKFDIEDRPVIHDSLTGSVFDDNYQLSYMDNIPSVAPLQGFVTQRSNKQSLFLHKGHHGVDIISKEGDPILAAASGVAVFSGWTYEFGNLIILYHGDDYFTHYGHNLQNLIQPRQLITRGEVIGLVGSTGISSGPHLHFEVWKEFMPVDPLIYFPEYRSSDLTSDNGKD
tara:strand:+ start:856 stop:1626 length:771 start_codon:yes stop_codon:yes gene_type:complete